MDGASEPREQSDPAVDTGVAFLRALFAETDTILFRPIETWTEAGKKRSRVDYRNTHYRKAAPVLLLLTLQRLLELSTKVPLNIFFGVCPRVGKKGRFDLAWQIRTIRVLWADIDHVSVAEARERVAKAGLPAPSIIVNSGNGVHLYWLLDEPYLIDDAGAPIPVETEWVEKPGGKKKARKYINENGDRVYLDQRRHLSRLGAKAQRVQDVIAGIASVCGGDHTHDLARLLRVPGTFNRKDQRNGREPVLTQLVECEPSRRYPFADFERFAKLSPDADRPKKIAAMPLPKSRKATAAKSDKLAELIATCAISAVGSRSETDFALCCYAIKAGIDKEQVWGSAEQVGKFAEQGRRYFDLTWEKAEFEVRAGVYEKLTTGSSATRKQKKNRNIEPQSRTGGPEDEGGDDSPPTIQIDAATTPVRNTLVQITDVLVAAKDCFMRCDQLVVIHRDNITSILSPPELAGLLNQHVEFYYLDEEGGEYRPLTAPYANTWLNQRLERARMPQIKLFTRNPVFTEDWRLLAPGFDAQSGIYYAGENVEPREGTSHLDTLLQDFCFKSPADRTNYLGMLLTAVLIPHFIGAKPAALFNGNQPGLGKTILAQVIAILRDGHPTETASFNPNDEEFEKRLGAIVRRGVTTIIIDNAKGQGRKPRIESACLERSITDAVLSFRLLGKSQEIRAENSHIFCITANTTDVGPDIVTRSVVMNLVYEGDPKRRKFHLADPEGYAQKHRVELLGELVGMVKRWKAAGRPLANVDTRFNKRGWGNIVGGILQTNGDPDFLGNAEEAAVQLDETRREFSELVAVMFDHEQGNWTAAELVELCGREGLLANDLGEGSPRSLSTKMGTISGRYVDERFGMPDGRQVVFRRSKDRKGNLYQVFDAGTVPNLGPIAEPLPNLSDPIGSAP